MNNMAKNQQLDIQEAAKVLDMSWYNVRYYQKHKVYPVPHYKRIGDWIKTKKGTFRVDLRLKGTRIVFFKDEILKWKKENKI